MRSLGRFSSCGSVSDLRCLCAGMFTDFLARIEPAAVSTAPKAALYAFGVGVTGSLPQAASGGASRIVLDTVMTLRLRIPLLYRLSLMVSLATARSFLIFSR